MNHNDACKIILNSFFYSLCVNNEGNCITSISTHFNSRISRSEVTVKSGEERKEVWRVCNMMTKDNKDYIYPVKLVDSWLHLKRCMDLLF